MPHIALGGERSNSGNKALASLWIRRLKPQEEPESLKGETFASYIETRQQGLHAGSSASGSSLRVQEASATKTWESKALSETEKLHEERLAKDAHVSSSEQQDYSGGEKQQNLFKQGRGRMVPLATPHTRAFGEQINRGVDAKCERKLPMMVDMNVNSRYTSDTAMISHTCPAAESKSQVSHVVRVQAAEGGIPATNSLGKPPLPPSHNKSGFPPRPAGKISSSPTSNKLAAIPLQDIVRHPSHIAVMKESLPLAITASAGLSPSKEGHQAKEDGVGCQDPLSKEKVFLMQHIPVSSSEGKSFTMPKKIARQDPEVIDAIALETESVRSLTGIGIETDAQPSKTLRIESTIPKPPSECSVVGSRQADVTTMKAAPSASTSANVPWEMFAGAAGPSRSAREEFVEVYNRARNELKNHKSSSSITKVFHHKEMENCPGFRDTSIVEHEGQTTDPDIPEKLSKAEGVECVVAQPGGMKVAVINDHVSHNRACFPDGEVDINPGKTSSQAFHSVHVTCGKKGCLYMRGQSGGPLHGCVEPPAVGQKDRVEKSSQCRQGFASSTTTPEHTASTHQELLRPTFVDQTDGVAHDNSVTQPNKKETCMVLNKRQLGMFDGGSPKESLQRERLPRKSDAWLQRWYPPYITNIKGSREHKILERDRLGQDLAGGSVRKANESDAHGSNEDNKKRVIEKGTLFQSIMLGAEPEHVRTSSKKVLPSAAAMAIVGTAAKQFCTVQPQHKGSFAFWSGFGMPAPQTPEHVTEKGKRKLTFEADPSPQP